MSILYKTKEDESVIRIDAEQGFMKVFILTREKSINIGMFENSYKSLLNALKMFNIDATNMRPKNKCTKIDEYSIGLINIEEATSKELSHKIYKEVEESTKKSGYWEERDSDTVGIINKIATDEEQQQMVDYINFNMRYSSNA